MEEGIPGLWEEPTAISPNIPVGATFGPAPDGCLCTYIHSSLYTANSTLLNIFLLRGGNSWLSDEQIQYMF